MNKTNRNNPWRWAVGLTLLAQLGLMQSAAATVGQIGYFEDKCPNGWKDYDKLAGRVVVGAGKYIGSSKDDRNESTEYKSGNKSGEVLHKLTVQEMPSHTHTLTAPRYSVSPGNWSGDGFVSGHPQNKHNNVGTASFSTNALGANQPHNNMQPYLVLTACIKVVDDNDKEQKEDKQVEETLIKLEKTLKKLKKRTNKLKEVVVNVSKHVSYTIDKHDREVLSDSE